MRELPWGVAEETEKEWRSLEGAGRNLVRGAVLGVANLLGWGLREES